MNQPDRLKATPISLTTPDFLDFANCHRDQNDRHFLQKLCRLFNQCKVLKTLTISTPRHV